VAGRRLRARELGAEYPRRRRGRAQAGGDSERYKVEEAAAEDAIPVLRKYIAEIRVTRPYFDAAPNSSDEAVAAELPRHTVFRLMQAR